MFNKGKERFKIGDIVKFTDEYYSNLYRNIQDCGVCERNDYMEILNIIPQTYIIHEILDDCAVRVKPLSENSIQSSTLVYKNDLEYA